MVVQRVADANKPPNSAVGYLAMQWSTGGWDYGSCALIDDRHLLTCSHNLIDPVTDPPPHGQANLVRGVPPGGTRARGPSIRLFPAHRDR
jgi:V8-like Glu-specific endopeptidase